MMDSVFSVSIINLPVRLFPPFADFRLNVEFHKVKRKLFAKINEV